MAAIRLSGAIGALVLAGILTIAGQSTASADALPRYEKQECWFPVPKKQKAECGFMTVEENHAQPNGRTVRLPVVVIKASSGKSKADPIVFLTGGPGQAIGADKEGIKRLVALRRLLALDGRPRPDPVRAARRRDVRAQSQLHRGR